MKLYIIARRETLGDDLTWQLSGYTNYFVLGVDSTELANDLVARNQSQITIESDTLRQTVESWQLVDDSFITILEQHMLDGEGAITNPTPVLDWH